MNRSRRLTTVKKTTSKVEKAKQLLHPSNSEIEMPCREKEYADIFNFVKSSLVQQVGGCMYIAGVPGTGKTATVHSVLRNLLIDNDIKKIKNKVKEIEINGLKLTDPNQFYSHLYYKLFGLKVGKQKAIDGLEDYFSNPQKSDPFVILVVDELDQLCTRKQNILYHLFDWPNRTGSRMVILSIANIMDLPERVMMSKIQSRLGLRRLQFQTYRFQELITIVESRVGHLSIFQEDGICLIARKVAAFSGDARRVLDLCRRALDIAEQEKEQNNDNNEIFVGMKHVGAALNEVFSSDKVYAINDTSEQERIFLQALIQEFKISGREEALYENIYMHHIEKCRFDKIYVPTVSELIEIADSLYSKRIILIEQNKLQTKTRISLNCSIDEVEYCLK